MSVMMPSGAPWADILDRFLAKVSVDAVTGCWTWQATINLGGYGQFSENTKPTLAHRWSYERFNGPIPAGMHIDHLCRNRACVNPRHLEAVTQAENNRRANALREYPVFDAVCKNGHVQTEATRMPRKGRPGKFRCRICANDAARRFAAKKKGL